MKQPQQTDAITKERRTAIEAKHTAMASKGVRVLGFARAYVQPCDVVATAERNMVWLRRRVRAIQLVKCASTCAPSSSRRSANDHAHGRSTEQGIARFTEVATTGALPPPFESRA
jgi:hypothetical protein